MVKRINTKLVAFIGFIFIALCSISLADETLPFKDIQTSEYQEAIVWAKEQGITSGYPDGTFKPDKVCTVKEGTSFLRAAFAPTVYADFENYLYMRGTFSSNDRMSALYGKGTDNISPFSIIASSLYYSGYTPYKVWMYEDPDNAPTESAVGAEDYEYLINILGLDTYGETITRGEAIHIIYNISTGNFDIPTPLFLDSLNISYSDEIYDNSKLRSKMYDHLYQYYSLVPSYIKDDFNSNGYKFQFILKDEMAEYFLSNVKDNLGSEYDVSAAVGLYSGGDKVIRIAVDENLSIGSTILHEIGHFVADQYGFRYVANTRFREYSNSYIRDNKALAKYLNWDYCSTNKNEYFAEVFARYLMGDDKWMEKNTQTTYKFIQSIIEK